MIPFKPILDNDPALSHSPLLRAALLTMGYIEANGPIGLTPTRALKRYFVAWAAEAFEWPHYTAADLYLFNKVLNEPDFPPLVVLHDVLLTAKLARRYENALHLTKLARKIKDDPAALWTLLAQTLLETIDHSRYTRYGDKLMGNWTIFLNVINIETQHGVTDERLCSILFGGAEEDIRRSDYRLLSALYIHIIRPLCWAGLLAEIRTGKGVERREYFVKTPLWPVALALETDEHLQSITCH